MAVAEKTNRKKPGRAQAGSPLIEFTAAAHEHVEPGFDVSQLIGAASIQLGPFDVPAYGFMRHVLLYVTSSGGVAGTGTLSDDAPWSVFDEITLLDVNGAPIFGPLTGYQTFLVNVFGGYAFTTDPALDPDFSNAVSAPVFMLRIPIEIQHNNGLGALANQNAAAAYKVRLRLAPDTSYYLVKGTATSPTLRIRGYLEAWSQPNPTDLLGRPQATRPPRHGTTQYWSVNQKAPAAGASTQKLDRVGNLLRTIILVNRTAATGLRSTGTANFPDPVRWDWDARQLINEPRDLRRKYQRERLPALAAMPAGVFVYDFNHDVLGKIGDGTPELWLPTVQATRLELTGSWGAACTLEMICNDVAPVETSPSQRFEEGSETGFTPEVGSPLRGGA